VLARALKRAFETIRKRGFLGMECFHGVLMGGMVMVAGQVVEEGHFAKLAAVEIEVVA
jgi:hypothetical protein